MTNSPRLQHEIERFSLEVHLAAFPPDRHLKDRERQYCTMNINTHGIFVVRETEEGWWRESIDFKGDLEKQIEKLTNDETVACGWINTARFCEPGGWHDPS